MTHKVYPLSDLNHLLSKDKIAKDDILQFQDPSFEE